jgi:hypothetical protein
LWCFVRAKRAQNTTFPYVLAKVLVLKELGSDGKVSDASLRWAFAFARREWSWESFILGVVEVGLGIMLFFSETQLTPIVRTSAILWALAGGTSLLLQSLRLRRQYRRHPQAMNASSQDG